jgi:hypothetical protein
MAKHNKKRNTMFIYETLIREVVKQSVNKNTAKRDIAIGILKEYFKKDTQLRQELDLYRTLLETKGLPSNLAERLVAETVKQHRRVDQKKLFSEQSAAISAINKKISKSVFSNFVPNYKDLATISQVFADATKPKRKVMLENRLVQRLSSAQNERSEGKGVSPLVVKSFVKRFNKEYTNLLDEQKELLSKYIGSFADDAIEFNFYLNEEIGRLKEAVSKGFDNKEVQGDAQISEKLKAVEKVLSEFSQKPLDQEGMTTVLKIQALAKELSE